MQEGQDLASFIEEQRTKLAYDRDRLKNNPPSAITDNTFNRQVLLLDKENQMPSNSGDRQPPERQAPGNQKPLPIQTTVRPPSTPRILKLGDDYKKKREKLNEELREDYRNAMAERNLRTGRRQPAASDFPLGTRTASDLGLSLPLKDRLSAKERMKLQRNKEYNDFLQVQDEHERQRREARSLSRSPVRLAPAATTVTKYFDPPPNNNNNNNPNAISKPSMTDPKDATTETYEELLERKRRQERSYRGVDHEDDDQRERPTRYRDDEPDDGYYSQRKVRFPSKGRRSEGRASRLRRSDDFVDYDEDEDAEYRARRGRRKGRQRRRGRRYDSEEDSEFDSEEEERLRRRKKNTSMERRQVIPAYEREATTASLNIPVSKTKQDDTDFRSRSVPVGNQDQYTGLPVGNVPSANTVQKRKNEYRDQLLEQMQQNKLQKQKEKELDRKAEVAAVNANNNNSRPKRIDNNRKSKDTSPPKRPAATESEPKKDKRSKKVTQFDVESSSDGEDERRARRHRYHYPPGPYFGPPPPGPPLGYYPSQYPAAYGDPYSYYGTRNPLDPATALGAPPAAAYPGVSPILAAAGLPEQSRELPERSSKSKVAAPVRRSYRNDSSLVADEERDKERKKQQTIDYQEELKVQIAQKQRQKAAAKQELDKYNQKMEEEARNYNPWGKGGGGAPMKDRQGNLISDLRQMHLENEEVLRDPTKAEEVVLEKLPQTNLYKREDRPVIDLSPRKYNEGDPLSPRFGRSNPFENRQSDEQRSQRDVYKEYLQKQIEEKKRLEAEKKERERIEEEKEEKRLEEQRKRMQAELEAEQEKERRKQEAARQKNEELRIQIEEKRKGDQQKKLLEEEQLRQQKEEELTQKLQRATQSPPVPALRNLPNGGESARPPSQPIPTLRNQQPQQSQRVVHTPRQPVAHSPRVQTYRVSSPTQPTDRRPNIQNKEDSKRISRELSALRNQLRSEQRRVEDALKTVDQPVKVNNDYLVDIAKSRQKPVSVRRPPTVEKERPDSRALEEFTAYKHRPDDTASIRMFRAEYPNTPDDARGLETQQRALLAQQDRKLEDLRNQALLGGKQAKKQRNEQRKPQKPQKARSPSVVQSRASLLDAETAYIPIAEDEEDTRSIRFHFDSNQSSPPISRQSRRPSARERRRANRRPPSEQSAQIPIHRTQSDNFSLNSISSLATLDVDRIANKNRNRLDKLRLIQGDDVSLTDPDDILDRFVNKQKGRRPPTNDVGRDGRPGPSGYRDHDHIQYDTRPPSVNTLDTEPWLRPETGPTVA